MAFHPVVISISKYKQEASYKCITWSPFISCLRASCFSWLLSSYCQIYKNIYICFPSESVVKNLPANA